MFQKRASILIIPKITWCLYVKYTLISKSCIERYRYLFYFSILIFVSEATCINKNGFNVFLVLKVLLFDFLRNHFYLSLARFTLFNIFFGDIQPFKFKFTHFVEDLWNYFIEDNLFRDKLSDKFDFTQLLQFLNHTAQLHQLLFRCKYETHYFETRTKLLIIFLFIFAEEEL